MLHDSLPAPASPAALSASAGPRLHLDAHDRRRLGVLALAWLALTAVAVGIGSLFSGATSPDHDIPDHGISVWFAEHRSTMWDKVTAVMSGLASTFVVIAIALIVVLVGLFRHRTAGVMFVVLAMTGEVTMFLTITLLVDRSRPDVPHLDPAPPTSSFPSGHTFATFVLWNAIAVLAVRQEWKAPSRAVARFLAVAMPAAVGLSRVYRGMHHPTDVLAALVLGMLWTLAVAIVVNPDAFRSRRNASVVSGSNAVRPADPTGGECATRSRCDSNR